MNSANEELKSDPAYGYNEERKMDSRFKSSSPFSSVTLPIDRIPEDLTRRMTKVFSKHDVREVREWG